MRVTFPAGQWVLYTSNSKDAPEEVSEFFHESVGRPSIGLMIGHLNSALVGNMWNKFVCEHIPPHVIGGISPRQYVRALQYLHRTELEGSSMQEEFLRERHTEGQTWQ